MYNKKCISTFLFSLALISLITLIVPFMNVGIVGDNHLIVKIFYYIFIILFSLSNAIIIIIGIFNLFKNNFTLTPIQEILSFVSFISLLINAIIILPINNVSLTVGYSILLLESLVMSCFNEVLRLIKKMPRTFKTIKDYIYNKKQQKIKIEEEKKRIKEEESKKNNHQLKLDLDNEDGNITITDENEEVKIIPPDEEIV